MDKITFNNLDIMEQIEYINNSLLEGGTLTGICKTIGIGRSTISDRFKKIEYKYSKEENKYIHNASNTDVNKVNNKPIQRMKNIEINNINVSNTDVMTFDNEVIQSNLINIASEYQTLIEMIELYKRNSNVLSNQIIIDLPSNDNKLTTMRVNTDVLQMFNDFAEQNNQFKKMDLVSMALLEYIQNHKG